jgi:hypothetical protein
MHKLQITAIGEPADVLEHVEFQAAAPPSITLDIHEVELISHDEKVKL